MTSTQPRKVKTTSVTSSEAVRSVAETRFATLRGLDPSRVTTYIEAFEDGNFTWLAPIMRKMEERNSVWKIAALKTRKAVSGRTWSCDPLPGYESDPLAKDQADVLTAFYGRMTTSDIRTRNITHKVRTFIENAMRAYNDGWSVHELVFSIRPDGSLDCNAVSCPLHLFRLDAGNFCIEQQMGQPVPIVPGEWLVVKGDGVGLACTVANTFRNISLSDWLIYSGRCGHPGLHGKTSAQKGTQQWIDFKGALSKFGKEWSAITGLNDVIEKIDLSVAGQLPYPAMVELMDRAIAALQRGADLSTMSAGGGSGEGASLQGDESDIIMCDNCRMIMDAFRSQIDATVLRWHYGEDVEVKAGFAIDLPQADTVDRDIKIDTFLRDSGVGLSRKDAIKRYQRTVADAADPEDAALVAPAAPATPLITGTELAPVAPASTATQGVKPTGTDSVADTALNGAQITSMVDLIGKAARKEIPMETLMPILQAAFPTIGATVLEQTTAPLKRFTPPPTELANETDTPASDPVAKRRESVAKREDASATSDVAKKVTPTAETILEGFADEAAKSLYDQLLTAAIEGSKQ